MSDLNAAIGLTQLKDFQNYQKKDLAKYYDENFKKFSNYVKIFNETFTEVPHIYCLLIIKSKNRNLIKINY